MGVVPHPNTGMVGFGLGHRVTIGWSTILSIRGFTVAVLSLATMYSATDARRNGGLHHGKLYSPIEYSDRTYFQSTGKESTTILTVWKTAHLHPLSREDYTCCRMGTSAVRYGPHTTSTCLHTLLTKERSAVVTLAYKSYKEDTSLTRDSHPITCCNCLQKCARYSSTDSTKAEDCKDNMHSSICWLCEKCIALLGAIW